MSGLVIEDLQKSFGPIAIMRGIDLEIASGELHAIIGPNGAGKSTLFNLVSGRLLPNSGRVLLDGQDITGLSPFEIYRRGLSRSFQVTNIFPRLSVFENLRCAGMWAEGTGYAFWRGLDRFARVRERAERVLEEVGLTARRETPAGTLTYAEQRALEIGLTIAGGARTILLDEPTAGMSRGEAEHAVNLIRRIAQGRTLVMIEHDMGVVFDLAARISVLVHGRVIATDTPSAIKANAAVQEAYLGTPMPSHEVH